MSELKSRHRIELERGKTEIEVVQKAKDEEMEEVHKRQVTIYNTRLFLYMKVYACSN